MYFKILYYLKSYHFIINFIQSSKPKIIIMLWLKSIKFRIFIIICFLYPILASQNQCPQGTYQIIDSNQNFISCAIQLQSQPTNFTVTTKPIYLYFRPTYHKYRQIIFYFCGQNIPNAINILNYFIENPNSAQNPNASDVNPPLYFNATSTCTICYMINPSFKLKSNDQYTYVIFSLSLNSTVSQKQLMQSFVISATGINYIPLLISGLGLLIMMFATMVIIYIRRRCERRRIIQTQNLQIQNYEKCMPKIRFEQLKYNIIVNCSICLGDIGNSELIRKTPCQHIFHVDCIDDWYKKNASCPMCRLNLQIKQLQKRMKAIEEQKKLQLNFTNIRRYLLQQKIQQKSGREKLNQQL